ncbi:MAG: histidine phosphatase family protein, partial [Desulfofustis sp.]
MEIYLLRHGATCRPGTYSGRSDIQLSETGRDQIRALRPLLNARKFDQCYCSPLSRCRETFELLEIA